MNCARYRQLISRYVDDEVTPRQRQDLLAHVDVCRDCAAWLARARQTDVLLKPMGDIRPSDSVRNAILSQLRTDDRRPATVDRPVSQPQIRNRGSALRILLSSFLLRFDPSPRRVALGFLAASCASLGLLFWLNILPHFWSNKLGFEVQPDSTGVASTSIPIPAISSNYGAGAANAPGLVLAQPGDGSQVFDLTAPVIMRFDVPMDRGSVEDALLIAPPAAGTLAWDADNQVRWTPSAPGFLRGITYTVSISGTALSQAGTPLRRVSSWSFRTADPHAVSPSPAGGSAVGPADSFYLTFDAPMRTEAAQVAVSLRSSNSNQEIPANFAWDAEGKRLTVTPLRPLPEGHVSILVDATAPTQLGDTLGRSYEFEYNTRLPSPRVRLLGSRISLANAGEAPRVTYEAASGRSSREALEGVSFEIFAFPAEMLSVLGAQASAWPQALPAGFPSGLVLVGTASSRSVGPVMSGDAFLPSLSPGIYLVVARGVVASEQVSSNAAFSDWQLLIVSDHKLISTGKDLLLWAVTEEGHAWTGAEISFYSPEGALLEKGLTSGAGLYSPTAAARGAGLALARDPFGHIAPLILDATFALPEAVANTLPANLITDRQAYRPSDIVNFRATIQVETLAADDATRLDESREGNATVQLLTPQGYVVSTLSLKPDSAGGVGGLFTLASTAPPGAYSIRVSWDNAARDFPLEVLSPSRDTLSVAVLPPTSEGGVGDTVITRTVSVLGPAGQPQAGVVVTGRLSILDDPWTSQPVIATTDGSGFANFVVPLPDWHARFNEPGLFFRADASSGGLSGAGTQFLDFTSQRSAVSGQTQAVAPAQNVAVVARLTPAQPPDTDAHFKVRAVLLDPASQSGDTLLIATSPGGEQTRYSLNLETMPSGDATIELPLSYAGGTIGILSSGTSTPRLLRLVPAGTSAVDLRVLAPITATASSEMPVKLALSNSDGVSLAGNAGLVWRRVSGAPSDFPTPWQPAVVISSSGSITTTMRTPPAPGLWYLMSEATTEAGVARGWTVVRVEPAPWVQMPPSMQAEVGVDTLYRVRIFNPGESPLQAQLEATGSASYLVGAGTKSVAVPANSWVDQQWQHSARRPGDSGLTFSFVAPDSDSQAMGAWPLAINHLPHANTNVTYTAGALSGERNVGVAVPWDLDGGQLTLEIRASTSLLASLTGTARNLYAAWASPAESVSMAAARLSAGAPVASAYGRSGDPLPDGLLLSGVERSTLLQELYAAQHSDGSWSHTLDGRGAGSVAQTAAVLLAFYRSSYYPYGDGHLQPDERVIERALAYLSAQLTSPPAADATSIDLESRAYALYAFSLYRPVPDDRVRPLLAFAIPDPVGKAPILTIDGLAYLALALMQLGRTDDALALLDSAIRLQPADSAPASAPMLIALLQAEADAQAGGQPFASNYIAIRNPQSAARNSRYAESLMGAREGAGWHTPLMTADAIWALALYAAMEGEDAGADIPTLLLDDRPIKPTDSNGVPGELSVLLSGDELRAGTNWLKLRSPASGEPLYYSFTLIATR